MMPISKLKLLTVVLSLAGVSPALSGCGGPVNVQASGGGAEGFASLGAIILGTTALRYIRDTDRESKHDDQIPSPPDTTGEQQENSDQPGSRDAVENP